MIPQRTKSYSMHSLQLIQTCAQTLTSSIVHSRPRSRKDIDNPEHSVSDQYFDFLITNRTKLVESQRKTQNSILKVTPFTTIQQSIASVSRLTLNKSERDGQTNSTSTHSQKSSFIDVSQKNRKYSLAKSKIGKVNAKRQVKICLKYSDLSQNIQKSIQNQENSKNIIQSYKDRHALYLRQNTSWSFFQSFLCSSGSNSHYGCRCEPKCMWIKRWKQICTFKHSSVLQIKNTKMQAKQWQKTVNQIQKDVTRTHTQTITFQQQHYVSLLRQSLLAYCKKDPQTGYMQGMNMFFAAIIYHTPQLQTVIQLSNWMMIDLGLRLIYAQGTLLAKKLFKQLIEKIGQLCYDLYQHLSSQLVFLQNLIIGWYFSLLGAFVPLEKMHLIIDKFIHHRWQGINQILLTFFLLVKDDVMKCQQEDLLQFFSSKNMTARSLQVQWKLIVVRSDSDILRRTK